MRLRNVSGSRDVIAQSPLGVHDPETLKNNWNKAFGSDHPIRIEVGMGKGKFIHTMDSMSLLYV